MIVTNRYFRPIRCAQAQFNPRVPAIDVHFGIRRIEKHIIVRKEPAIAVIPTAKLCVTSLEVAKVGFGQLERYVVIVEIPKRVTSERELSVFADSSLQVQILNTAVSLIAWKAVFLFELRTIAASDDSADCELDPIFVFVGLLFGGRSS